MLHRLRRRAAALVENHPRLRTLLGSCERRLHRLHHSFASRAPILIRPRTRNLTVAITARCNLRCVGCRYGRDYMPGRQLSWPIARDLIDDGAALGVESLRLYGGEPLLHRDLPRMVARARDRGLDPYVTTNAILLADKIGELYDAGLRFLTIGYYGTEADYDAYVGRRDAYRHLERAVATIRERYGDEVRVRINWLLMRPSCDPKAVREVWRFASRYRTPIQVDLIHYSLPYFSEGPDRKLQFRAADRPRIERVVDELLTLRSSDPELIETSETGLRAIPDWLIEGPRMRVPCDKYRMVWVGADGSVRLCYVTFHLGNLHDARLTELLYTDAHRAAARGAFQLRCPNCHCGFDQRTEKHAPSRRRYGRVAAAPRSGDRVG